MFICYFISQTTDYQLFIFFTNNKNVTLKNSIKNKKFLSLLNLIFSKKELSVKYREP